MPKQNQDQNQESLNFVPAGVNMEVAQVGNELYIHILDLNERNGDTGTGGSKMVATSGGFQFIQGFPGLKYTAMVIEPYTKEQKKQRGFR